MARALVYEKEIGLTKMYIYIDEIHDTMAQEKTFSSTACSGE